MADFAQVIGFTRLPLDALKRLADSDRACMLSYDEFHAALLAVFLIIGLVLLCLGGDWLAAGASGLALSLKINPVVVGLTIVSVATSMPELITSFIAASRGSTGLAVGNIIGSNIGNSALIMGVAAIICPVAIQARLIRQEMPILLAATLAFAAMSMGGFLVAGQIGQVEGIFLFSGAVAYLVFLVQQSTRESKKSMPGLEEEIEHAPKSVGRSVLLVVVGAIGLAVGADLLVGSATQVAHRLNVSDVLVGLTIVALGTSLPELAASVAAARRKESDIIAGNIIGSNIFNILLIGGGVASFYPIPVDSKLMTVEFPALVLTTVILWVALYTGKVVTRLEGILLVILYFLIIGLATLVQTGVIG